jgi:hypothetical protein
MFILMNLRDVKKVAHLLDRIGMGPFCRKITITIKITTRRARYKSCAGRCPFLDEISRRAGGPARLGNAPRLT